MKTKYAFVFTLAIGLLSGYQSHSQEAVVKDTTSLWDNLGGEFALKRYETHEGIAKQRSRYLEPSYELDRILDRASPYLHFIHEEIKKRNLPAELALLPLVESNYNPHAQSNKSAAGLWQIIPATGEDLGLIQNRWYDGRHDIYASTKAALNHLAYLNKKFDGDWLITLSAYNAGEGAIGRVIERNRAAGKPTDYWSLSIPYLETRLYVQRFLALADIVKNSDQYDFALPSVPNRPALTLVTLEEQMPILEAAEKTGMNVDEIYQYNPGLNRALGATPPNGPHHLLLPVEHAEPLKVAAAEETQTLKKLS